MSTTLTTTATGIRRTTRTTRSTPSSARRTTSIGPATLAPVDPQDLLGKRPPSELTRMVFCVLLGIAASLALVGVVSQASTTSPDAPPPAVIVEFD